MCRPASTFSITVASWNNSRFWKVLAMPSRAIWFWRKPSRLVPSNSTSPPFGVATRVSRLKIVVLPAPFGPMIEKMLPGRDLEGNVAHGVDAAEAHAEMPDLKPRMVVPSAPEPIFSRARPARMAPSMPLG